ncbi:hypothetical protein AG1IA_00655 [Rhizoctonia solani AG-1 IA]|uniref:Uncharacterized protein n=1 Tax=Thanatephorus cucumeris (strain AG1-IA) TaxID=983506 RepID=L8X8D2_THACA|nr:hypothetical protein AG1IA_00655 [Rhizoctonia solani AG-1 IA]
MNLSVCTLCWLKAKKNGLHLTLGSPPHSYSNSHFLNRYTAILSTLGTATDKFTAYLLLLTSKQETLLSSGTDHQNPLWARVINRYSGSHRPNSGSMIPPSHGFHGIS